MSFDVKVYQKQYRADHVEDIVKQKHDWYIDNRDRILEDRQEYRKKNADKIAKRKKIANNLPAEYKRYYEKLSPYDPCRQDPDNPELLQVRCKYCNKWLNPTRLAVRCRIAAIKHGFKNKKGEANLYCSDGCKRSCPTFGQKLYPKDFKQNTSREVQPELRKMVLERDNWTCQKCGKSKDDFPELELHCHHIFPLNENPVESADIDNCITYCKECHKWIHKNVPGCGYAEMKCSEDTDAA